VPSRAGDREQIDVVIGFARFTRTFELALTADDVERSIAGRIAIIGMEGGHRSTPPPRYGRTAGRVT
jgi:hypothetical protein